MRLLINKSGQPSFSLSGLSASELHKQRADYIFNGQSVALSLIETFGLSATKVINGRDFSFGGVRKKKKVPWHVNKIHEAHTVNGESNDCIQALVMKDFKVLF